MTHELRHKAIADLLFSFGESHIQAFLLKDLAAYGGDENSGARNQVVYKPATSRGFHHKKQI